MRSSRFSLVPRVALIVLLGFGLGSCANRHETSEGKVTKVPLDPQALEFVPVKPDSIALVVAASGGKATLVNVWASWCDPCREEFPEIVRLAREYRGRGLEVIFISADFAEDLPNARKFLAAQGVDWPTYYKIGNDQRFIAALDQRWSGALPGTFVYDAQGRLRDYWEGKASYAKFEKRVRPILSLPELPVSTEASDTSKEDHS